MELIRSRRVTLRTHLQLDYDNYYNQSNSSRPGSHYGGAIIGGAHQSCACWFPFVVINFKDATAFSIAWLARRTILLMPGEASIACFAKMPPPV